MLLCLLFAIAALGASTRLEDPESRDKRFCFFVNIPGVKGKEYKVGNSIYKFRVKEEQTIVNRNTTLIDQLDSIMGLEGKELKYESEDATIILDPFKSLKLITEDGVINIGYYSETTRKKDQILHHYTGGDRCDICKDKTWAGVVSYRAGKGPLKLENPKESFTCTYKLSVEGTPLGTQETYSVIEWCKEEVQVEDKADTPSSEGLSKVPSKSLSVEVLDEINQVNEINQLSQTEQTEQTRPRKE